MQTPRDLAESFAVLAVLVVAAVVCEMLIPNWSSAASRLLAPWQFVPTIGSVQILSVTPGNTDVLVGQSVEIAAEIENPEGKPHAGLLWVAPDGEAESQFPMAADQKHLRYKFTVPSVLKAFKYRLEIGDSQTPGVHGRRAGEAGGRIGRGDVPLSGVLGRARTTPSARRAWTSKRPQYTVAELRLHTSVPVAKGYLESEGERYVGPRRAGRQSAGGEHALVEERLV